MILDRILASKREEVDRRRAARPLADLERAARAATPPRDFRGALTAAGLAVIAEIKRRSPSAGDLRPDLAPADLARLYERHGARALSVLTDGPFFGGSDADLAAARAATILPVLRKDFVVDPYQVVEARAIGADAVLLIVRVLEDAVLRDLLALARDLGLAALVETHAAEEVERALAAGADLVGVNNRDLDTLRTDPTLAVRLRALIPPGVAYVAESGLSQPAQVTDLAAAGADAVLVGETFLRADDPAALLEAFVAAGAPAVEAGRG